jgi:ubiquinone/menaquinone biosynthesis C-methylase UbiE
MSGIGYFAAAATVTALVATGGVRFARSRLKRERKDHGNRGRLWDWFYGQDWGDVTTNNYGFAPARGDHPQRFQHQMYMELLNMLKASGRLKPHTDLLEVSCGRGGGLAHLVRNWPGSLTATGLDLSENALKACRKAHGDLENLRFVRGSALELPFPDGSFDVILNVEASNDYGDFARFFSEVHRVLKPDGVFLYTDTRRAQDVEPVARTLREAGFQAEFRDITRNAIEACRLDSPRRAKAIRDRAPWFLYRMFKDDLHSYAAVEGSRKFNKFVDGRRLYVMTAAVKAGT